MIAISKCPSVEQVIRLGTGGGEISIPPELAFHIEECLECQELLERRARDGLPSWSVATATLPTRGGLPQIDGFTIERELGRGGAGVVYLAEQAAPRRHVALKYIASGPAASEHQRRRWFREAEIASKVRHPNVVALHGMLETADGLILILEYIPGGSLQARLSGPLAPLDATRLMETVCRAVHHIHENRQLHLDLKPSNILLDGANDAPWDKVVPKVADFGIAISTDRHATETTGGHLAGTPSYMAPEQINGVPEQLGPATDIHALGAIFYQLLTGRPPFQGSSPLETIDQVRNQEAVSPRRLNPRIPRDLETIVLKCLEKNPSRRYGSAGELESDIRRVLDGRPIAARPVSLAEQSGRWCRRRPAVAGLAAVLALTVLTSFSVLFAYYRRAEAARQAAEQNLEVASTVIGRLEDWVLVSIRTAPLEELIKVTSTLADQLGRVRANRGFKHELLLPLSTLYECSVARLSALGRLSEARALLSDWLDLCRECRKRYPENEDIGVAAVQAHWQAASIEMADRRFVDALRHLDQATDLVLDEATAPPAITLRVLNLSVVYVQLQDELAREGNLQRASRCKDGRLRLLAFLEAADSGRPDLMLERACVLTDLGRWDDARELVRCLASRKHPIEPQPAAVLEAFDDALCHWFARELRAWITASKGQTVPREALRRDADRIVRLLRDVCEGAELRAPARKVLGSWMIAELVSQAAKQRKAGVLAEAEESVAFLMEIAHELVREFPKEAGSYVVLSEAFLQEYKNAWKRNPPQGIRRGLIQSIDAIQRALDLNPEDEEIRRNYFKRKQRLAGLPASVN